MTTTALAQADDRRITPRLASTDRAYFTSWDDGELHHGITDGAQTIEFATSTEALLAAKVHNLVNGHDPPHINETTTLAA